MMKGEPETLRRLKKDEKPKKDEIVWHTSDSITNIDQYMLARALLKRLNRQIKNAGGYRAPMKLQAQRSEVKLAILAWESR
jgi:hypothetical protein